MAGVGLRVRTYLGFGLAGLILAALWLTSSRLNVVLAAIIIVAIIGGALITLGAIGERRRKCCAQSLWITRVAALAP